MLEQHTKLGGCCHTFKEGRFEFDTGLHYVGNMQGNSETFRLLDQLTEGQLQWAPMDCAYDQLILGKKSNEFQRFNIYGNYNNWRSALKEYFPDETKAIDEFERLTKQLPAASVAFGLMKLIPSWAVSLLVRFRFMKPMSMYQTYFEKTSHEVVSSLTSNVKLQACLQYLWGDFGAPPMSAPFMLTSGANGHYIRHGAFYPRNGPAMIPYYLIKTVLKSGGKFFTKANVDQVLLRQNQKNQLEAYGVQVKHGKDSKIDFYAPIIVSGAGVLNTFQKLVPREITDTACLEAKWILSKLKPSVSYLNLFVGLTETSAELKLPAQNNWVITGPEFDKIYQEWIGFEDPFEALEKCELPLMFIGFPSAKDPNYDYNNARGSTCVAITLVPYSWFQMWNDLPLGKRGDQYEALKKAFMDKMWEKILQLYPQLEDKQEVAVLGSPVTSNHYLNTEYGEIYGLDHSVERYKADCARKLKPKTEVEGLYLTGQDLISCGVSSAITSGLMTCTAILRRDLFSDLKNLYK